MIPPQDDDAVNSVYLLLVGRKYTSPLLLVYSFCHVQMLHAPHTYLLQRFISLDMLSVRAEAIA